MSSSKRIKKHINSLVLDPNNYRFIDRKDYKLVSDEQVTDLRVQQRTLNFLLGKDNSNVSDLVSSFTTNGFLDIDQIQVRGVGDKFLVLEGNRRVATLKYLYEEYKKGNDVGLLEESDFKSINLVEITEDDPVQHLISMGLHHISGKKRWNAVNESQLVSDLINKYGKTEDEVCRALGISKFKLRRGLRALSLIKQYKESDYGDQFVSNMYTIFETVVGSPIMRIWLGWNENLHKAENYVSLERFFSWISETEERERTDHDDERVIKIEPIISQYRQIKELAEFINDEKALIRMEESRSIIEGYTYSDAIGENRLKNALTNIKGEVQVAFNFSEHLTEEEYGDIEKLKDKLDRLIPTSQVLLSTNNGTSDKYFSKMENHFSNIIIHNYRKLEQVKVKKLSRVNIFVGGNNVGKTSILESFYLSSQLNDINAFLGLEKYRGKFYRDLNPNWIGNEFKNTVYITGEINKNELHYCLTNNKTDDDIDKNGYISSLKLETKLGGIDFISNLHLYSNKEPGLKYSSSKILCNATFTSPYRYNTELLQKAHAFAVTEKYFHKIIAFIKEHLDNSIEDIEMINKYGENRFMVSSDKFVDAVDITTYGEGLQRVFEIALLMVYSKNGIICIDEVDSAIHKSLLIEFTKFIQQTAEEFNVQVFLSTHSKECIDAFIKNKYQNDNLTAYVLKAENDIITCKYVEGKRLEQLIESINFDIR